ncbi:MAG: restriction endonuclease subunit S [Lachnospiraceae bacterium]|nr:restriction endonuclease subunit S [Lachnospiraceae bacterium]
MDLVKTDGVNQSNINAKKIGAYSFDVPLLNEQAEIVLILDNYIAKEAEVKEKVEVTLDAIEVMKKSILAKAFRGELGTNDPEDESAEELLKWALA